MSRKPTKDFAALAAADARWIAAMEAAVDGVVVIDDDGTMRSCNPATTTMFGYERQEMLGENVSMLMPEPDRGRHDGYLKRYLETRKPHIIGTGREVQARRKDGTLFPVHLSVGEFRIGEERGFVGFLHDITNRVDTERRLREREQLLRMTFEEAPMASVTFDPDGRILTVNRQLTALLGYPADEASRLTLHELVHPDQPVPDCRRLFAEARDGDTRTLPLRFLTREGDERLGDFHVGVVRDAERRPVFCVGQIEDLTERRRVEEEARASRDKLAHVTRLSSVGEMATGIAHELNQPLSAIANYSRAMMHLIESGRHESGELLTILEKVNVQAQRAGDVIRRVRGFVSKAPSQREPCSLNAVIDEVLQLSETDAETHEVVVLTDLQAGLPQVLVDRVQLQQVLLNLLRNAIESTQESGRREPVCIRSTLDDDGRVHVAVEDHGLGISRAEEEKLFSTFFTTKTEGMGLGLSISRSIVEAYGGRLWFSRNPDCGVTFHVTLDPSNGAKS